MLDAALASGARATVQLYRSALTDHACLEWPERAVPERFRQMTARLAELDPGHVNLAKLHTLQGRYSEAEALFARAVAIQEKALGPTHPGKLSPS